MALHKVFNSLKEHFLTFLHELIMYNFTSFIKQIYNFVFIPRLFEYGLSIYCNAYVTAHSRTTRCKTLCEYNFPMVQNLFAEF